MVFWSALDRGALEAICARAGAAGVIQKTVGATALVDQVCDWLLAWDGVELRP